MASHPVRVAGSLPPLFGSYLPDLFDASEAARIIDPLIVGLAGHVDVWLGETLSSIVEATTVRQALDRAGLFRQPLWISYSLNEHGALRSGEPVADAVATAIDIGAMTILFNCCAAESITIAIDIAVTTANGAAAIGGYANRFVTGHTDDGEANAQISAFRDDLDPESVKKKRVTSNVRRRSGRAATLAPCQSAASVPAKICQARADFATRLSTM